VLLRLHELLRYRVFRRCIPSKHTHCSRVSVSGWRGWVLALLAGWLGCLLRAELQPRARVVFAFFRMVFAHVVLETLVTFRGAQLFLHDPLA
jgi:hypothetical protein